MQIRRRLAGLAALLVTVVCLPAAAADDCQQHIARGRTLQQAGHYREALQEFEAARKDAARTPDPDLRSLALATTLRGMSLMRLGESADAERDFRAAVRLYEQAEGPQSVQLAMVLGDLGDVYLVRGQPASARRALDRALSILDATQPADSTLRGPLLQSLARLAMLRHDYAVAGDLLEKARMVVEKNSGRLDRHAVQIREDQMELARLEGNAAREVSIAERTLQDYVQVEGARHPAVAIAYSNMAAAYRDAGRMEDAREAIRHALALAKEVLPDDHPRYAAILNNYVELMKGTGEGEKLKEKSARAKAILEDYNRRNTPWTVDAGDAAYAPKKK